MNRALNLWILTVVVVITTILLTTLVGAKIHLDNEAKYAKEFEKEFRVKAYPSENQSSQERKNRDFQVWIHLEDKINELYKKNDQLNTKKLVITEKRRPELMGEALELQAAVDMGRKDFVRVLHLASLFADENPKDPGKYSLIYRRFGDPELIGPDLGNVLLAIRQMSPD